MLHQVIHREPRRSFFVWLFALLIVCLLVVPARADDGGTIVDTRAIIDYVVYAALSLASLGGTWLFVYLKKLIGIKTDQAVADNIRLGLENALRAAYAKHGDAIRSKGLIAVKSAITSDALNYLKDHFPDATKHFGLERPEDIARMVEAYLPKVADAAPAAKPAA